MARALRRAGIKRNGALEDRAPHGRDQARASAERLLSLPDPPTAIFAASDVQAMGVLEAARAGGLRVPEDLAVIGFDDVPLAAYTNPPLSTVRQPMRGMGEAAARLLMSHLDGGEQLLDEPHIVPTELVVRGSSLPQARAAEVSVG